MVLALSAVRHADQQFTDPVITPLSAQHCTIGRSQDCDIVLEDPTRQVSRKHATILRQGDDYYLTVNSQTNPVFLNGDPVSQGQQAALGLGDSIVVGEYEFNIVAAATAAPGPARADPLADLPGAASGPVDLDALFGSAAARPAPRVSPGGGMEALFGAQQAQASDPLLDILGGNGGSRETFPVADARHDEDPLMRILGSGPTSDLPAPGADAFLSGPVSSIDDLIGGGAGAHTNPLGLTSEMRQARSDGAFGGGIDGSLEIDHVHDVNLPMPSPAPATARAAAQAKSQPARSFAPAAAPPIAPVAEADPLAGLFGPEAVPGGAAAEDPLGLFGGATPAGATTSPRQPELRERPKQPAGIGAARDSDSGLAEDPLGLLGSSAAQGAVPGLPPEAPERTDELAALGPRGTPSALRARVASQPPPAGTLAPQGAGSMQEAIRAFLEGAGMTGVNIPDADADAFIRECGDTVRAAVEGVMGMLLARAKVKQELRALDRTMVASSENNALKLTESVDEALRYVFDPATRMEAFLPPPKAMADACSDLQAHEIAVVAGMRAALLGAVKLFAPAVIEKKLEKDGGKKSLLANKKALLWDKYVAHYQDTEKDAEDNFDRVFGAAFLRAYQQQVRLLRRH